MPTPSKPEYLGEPTLGQVMRRPIWILALLCAFIVAGAFAWLGQWQMGIAVRSGDQVTVDTETPRTLAEVSDLAKGVTEDAAGVVVNVSGEFVPGDTRVVAPRDNAGKTGAWVVGHLITDPPERAHLAVAIGWAPSEAAAERALVALDADPALTMPRDLQGRYMPPEGPQVPGPSDDPQMMRTMIPAHFANVWADVDAPVYSGYLVLHDDGDIPALLASADLDPIDSVSPLPPETVSWLNVFYAIEWVVFAGFAVFFWFRLTRDAWEKEHEMQELEAEAAASGADDGTEAADDADASGTRTRSE
ncbi:cytochrome oxidase assembly protein ShyY1 [Leucobacter luti]|uniref:SURF1-like protein n=1 Tax=Leucobacter luti TaxID=340320 RepID=A0A4R6S7W0_9MICO|nr:SURF1 family cytochrome oxidase biogenesis protein [Leucobacter luti]TDP95821.1 cytochrome oxidase assembly protein ShyY1 [Leucobacter luti]